MDRPLNRERIRPTTSRGVTGSWFIWTYEAVEVFGNLRIIRFSLFFQEKNTSRIPLSLSCNRCLLHTSVGN